MEAPPKHVSVKKMTRKKISEHVSEKKIEHVSEKKVT